MKLDALYSERFPEQDRAFRIAVWDVLWRHYFSRFVTPNDTVLDLGAGYCELINSVAAKRRIAVDLNPDTKKCAAAGVEVHNTSAETLGFLGDGEIDVVFTSNFIEHLPSKAVLLQVIEEVRRVLRPGGTLVLLGPNIRFVPDQYWDFYDHQIPLSDRSVGELLQLAGLEVVESIPRFLPFTTKGARLRWPWLVRAYLLMAPVSMRLFGKQFLVVAKKHQS